MKTLFVLAGGFGTRLRPVISNVPKPLAPVGGEPFLFHLVRHWVSQGVDDFIFFYIMRQIKLKSAYLC